MKLLHLPYCYHPDPVGGTEIYVQALAKAQTGRGHSIEIAAPASENATYKYDGIPVHRFAVKPDLNRHELYGRGDRTAAAEFRSIVAQSKPDIVHLHGITSALSVHIVSAAHLLGIPVVLTCHTPTVICGRGTLLRFGREICDGAISVRRCSACVLHGRGLDGISSHVLSCLPLSISGAFAALPGAGPAATVLGMPELTSVRQQAIYRIFQEVDQIVAVCEWMKRALVVNGVPEQKITVCRQGLPFQNAAPERVAKPAGSPLRVVFAGRLDSTKGAVELAEAVAECCAAVSLDIYGVVQGAHGERIRKAILGISSRDARVKLLEAVPAQQIVATLSKYDVLAVPSQWLETGPLVVYEAFAAGLPVVGSDLGGIAELVKHGENGLLVKHDSKPAWVRALTSLASDRALLERLRSNLPRARTMADAADEMSPMYERALAARAAVAAGSFA